METVTISRTEYESFKALQEANARLEQQVDYLLRQARLSRHFGPSSEKSEYDQLSIFNEVELTANVQAPEPELIEVEKHYRKRKRLVNDKLPEDLPVEVVEHDLPPGEKVCSECGGTLHQIGKETRRELKLIPAKAVIVEHVSYVYGCHECERDEFGVPVQRVPMDEP